MREFESLIQIGDDHAFPGNSVSNEWILRQTNGRENLNLRNAPAPKVLEIEFCPEWIENPLHHLVLNKLSFPKPETELSRVPKKGYAYLH